MKPTTSFRVVSSRVQVPHSTSDAWSDNRAVKTFPIPAIAFSQLPRPAIDTEASEAVACQICFDTGYGIALSVNRRSFRH
jgi:hypothetical protein